MPGKNNLAYLASSSATTEKCFITLTPDVNVIKLFFRVIRVTNGSFLMILIGSALVVELLNDLHGSAWIMDLHHRQSYSHISRILKLVQLHESMEENQL